MAYKYSCPSCSNDIIVRYCKPGEVAICKTCLKRAVVPEDATVVEDATEHCRTHPEVVATNHCANCGAPICGVCSLRMDDNRILCMDCAAAPQAAAREKRKAITTLPEGLMCAFHSEVAAVAVCVNCGAGICTTCDFAIAGGLHVCPNCATRPSEGLDRSRRIKVILAYIMAGIATLGMIFLFFGSAFGLFIKISEDALGVLFSVVGFWPGLIGLILAAMSYEKRRHNPGYLIGAIVWNSIILAFFIILNIIGLMMQG